MEIQDLMNKKVRLKKAFPVVKIEFPQPVSPQPGFTFDAEPIVSLKCGNQKITAHLNDIEIVEDEDLS